MDDLDRLYRRLVHNIRANRPEYLQIPFTVRELYEQIIPYRHNRRELAIETNDDYEVSIARLLSGERGYLQSDPALQEALGRELASPTGDPGIFKDHGDSVVSLTQAAADTRTPVPATVGATAASGTMKTPASGAGSTGGSTPPAETNASVAGSPGRPSAVPVAEESASRAATVPAAEGPVPSLISSLTSIDVPTGCRFCSGTLPEGRDVNYCPHCGENLRTKRCPSCGSEMDTSWGFCVTCGRKGG